MRRITINGTTYYPVSTILLGPQPKPALDAWAAQVVAAYVAKEES